MILRPAGAGPLRAAAPAKVNLFLEVLGKRPDGFHEIATLMLAIDLCDELTFEPADEVSLTCDDPALTIGPDNLIVKAARQLAEATGCSRGARIGLTKRIPWAAGLGGGSSDGAATLAGLNVLWELGLGTTELAQIGARLGSDVPFFLNGPAAWCTGRGEMVAPVEPGPPLDLVLVKPPEGLSTAEVYRCLTVPAEPIDGSSAQAALAAGDVEGLGRALFNRLAEPAFALSPTVAEWHRRIEATGPAGTLLSGSGSCLFALCRNSLEARRVYDDLSSGAPPGGGSFPRMFLVRSRP